MSLPTIVAIESDPDAVPRRRRVVVRPLRPRLPRRVHDRSADDARALLEQLAAEHADVALVLAAQWLDGTTGPELLDDARRLHPHARRGLLIAWGDWGVPATGDAIYEAISHARIDHFVRAPDRTPRRALPPHGLGLAPGVGRLAAGVAAHRQHHRRVVVRARLRAARAPRGLRAAACVLARRLGRWARPRRGGRGRGRAPARHLPRRPGAAGPDERRDHRSGGIGGQPDEHRLRPPDHRRRTGRVCPPRSTARPRGSARWSSTRAASAARRRRARSIRNYLGFARRRERPPARPAGVRAGVGVRRRVRLPAARHRPPARRTRHRRHPLRLGTIARPCRCCWRPGASYQRIGVPALEALNGAGVYYGERRLGGARRRGPRGLRGRRGELGRAGRAPPRPVRDVVSRSWSAPTSLASGMSQYLVRQVETAPNVEVRVRHGGGRRRRRGSARAPGAPGPSRAAPRSRCRPTGCS